MNFDSYRIRERAEIARLVLVGAFLVLSGAFFRTQVLQHEKFQLRRRPTGCDRFR
jgi:cell division protein FtsI/penicillin-binding protein 2